MGLGDIQGGGRWRTSYDAAVVEGAGFSLGQVNGHNSGCGRASTDTVRVEGVGMDLDELMCMMAVEGEHLKML